MSVNKDKKITMSRALWGRLDAMMKREGMAGNFSECLRRLALNACEASEAKEQSK